MISCWRKLPAKLVAVVDCRSYVVQDSSMATDSRERKVLFCSWCREVSNRRLIGTGKGESAFSDKDFCNWKDGTKKLDEHAASSSHRAAAECISQRNKPSTVMQLNTDTIIRCCACAFWLFDLSRMHSLHILPCQSIIDSQYWLQTGPVAHPMFSSWRPLWYKSVHIVKCRPIHARYSSIMVVCRLMKTVMLVGEELDTYGMLCDWQTEAEWSEGGGCWGAAGTSPRRRSTASRSLHHCYTTFRSTIQVHLSSLSPAPYSYTVSRPSTLSIKHATLFIYIYCLLTFTHCYKISRTVYWVDEYYTSAEI